jgi:hypothetical protein
VAFGDTAPDGKERNTSGNLVNVEARKLAVMIVNRSSSTITRVEAQFCLGNSMIPYHRLSGSPASGRYRKCSVPDTGHRPSARCGGVLTPFDTGIRFETDGIHERSLAGPYPVVRWTDRWGTTWEHKRGVARPVRDDEPWEP